MNYQEINAKFGTRVADRVYVAREMLKLAGDGIRGDLTAAEELVTHVGEDSKQSVYRLAALWSEVGYANATALHVLNLATKAITRL